MGNFSFRSAGKTTQDNIESSTAAAKTPTMYGIKTPLRSSTGGLLFDVTYSLKDQVADNLRNLLLTNYGERLGLYDYGANLRPITTELVSLDDFDSQAIERIRNAVAKWMPYISLNNFASSVDRNNKNNRVAAIKVMVTYDVAALDVKNAIIEITLYVT
jgi:phage baseplate assembly protein W